LRFFFKIHGIGEPEAAWGEFKGIGKIIFFFR
jgi:hypothetical protein